MFDPDARNRGGVALALEHVRRCVAGCREECDRILKSADPKPVQRVGVIGAGIMGTAIAIEHAIRSISVVLIDKDPRALRWAEATATCELATARKNRPQFASTESIVYTFSERDLGKCDLVVESIVEKLPAKQLLYSQIQPHLSDGAILATNTSTIPVSRLAAGLTWPDRFCGLHFCHPVRSARWQK